jgi:hypothetical protein
VNRDCFTQYSLLSPYTSIKAGNLGMFVMEAVMIFRPVVLPQGVILGAGKAANLSL